MSSLCGEECLRLWLLAFVPEVLELCMGRRSVGREMLSTWRKVTTLREDDHREMMDGWCAELGSRIGTEPVEVMMDLL